MVKFVEKKIRIINLLVLVEVVVDGMRPRHRARETDIEK